LPALKHREKECASVQQTLFFAQGGAAPDWHFCNYTVFCNAVTVMYHDQESHTKSWRQWTKFLLHFLIGFLTACKLWFVS